MDYIGAIKAAWTAFLGWTTSVFIYFLPVKDLMHALLFAFISSFILGVIAGIRVQNESLDTKKAKSAVVEVVVYLVALASLFIIGDKMDSDEFIHETISTITWGLIYIYITNCTKNLRRLMPDSKGIKYLHYVLSFEFLKKSESIKNFQDYENEGEKYK